MKLFNPESHFENRAAISGSVLIIVLWFAIGLVGIALYFANSMTYELRASDNRTSGLAAEQAIEGAARYVNYVLSDLATNGVMPATNLFACEAVPVGDAHFWMIGRDPSGTTSPDPCFGLVDEGSKLNLNTAGTNVLSYLPDMTLDFAEAIADWRSTNGIGTMSLNYNALGYTDKNAPFETVDELRLVYGATMDLLAGNDLNRNGVLDAGEKSANGGDQFQPGLFEYTTVYSREPNFNAGGGSLTNVNTATETTLQTLFQDAGVSSASARATAVYNRIHPQTGAQTRITIPCNGILDFCVRCKNAGMSDSDFANIYTNITTTNAAYIYGRVNVNTADEDVLTALFTGLNNGDEQTAESAAQTLVNYREQNPANLASVAWIVDALGNTSPIIRALDTGDYVTTRSFQFTADIAAIGPFGRGYRRVKFIFDTSDGTPKIIYRQDLSRLGWALGDKVRQTWVASTTQ